MQNTLMAGALALVAFTATPVAADLNPICERMLATVQERQIGEWEKMHDDYLISVNVEKWEKLTDIQKVGIGACVAGPDAEWTTSVHVHDESTGMRFGQILPGMSLYNE